MRPLYSLIFLIFPALLGMAALVHADPQGPTYNPPAGSLYDSPNVSAFGIPTGLLTIDLPAQSKFFSPTPAPVTSPLSPVSATSLLGCGGVGQGEYTSALFNMPEVFSKFQQDVNSPLAKALLTMNYSLPQTAALFDTLNAYGDQRYDQFQRGCSLDALKQDAKQQYLQACVSEQLPLRIGVIGTQNPQVQEPMKSSQAYAQAWEICNNQYVSNTQALAQRVSVSTAFAKEIRSAEYANIAIRTLLCGVSDTTASGCWQELLLPQVRICNDPALEGGCTPDGYGVEEAPIRMLPLFDTLRLAITEDINRKVVTNLVSQINSQGVPAAMQIAAAKTAVVNITTQPFKAAATNNLVDFEKRYLNCRSSDLLFPLKKYVDELNHALNVGGPVASPTSNQITMPTLPSPAFQSNTAVLLGTVPATSEAGFTADKEEFKQYVPSVVGCVSTQTIPLLDPMIIAQTNIQCSAEDLDAFYAVASYDVATTAIRETYGYLIDRLKTIHARLLVDPTRPQSENTSLDAGGKLPSKELNQRLATIVEDLMIPHMQTQLQRLDRINKARGEFGARIKQIYATKTGCVYNN